LLEQQDSRKVQDKKRDEKPNQQN
jgi:hypothetical protein